MTKLGCSVTSCAYNQSQCCCLPKIQVHGTHAENSHETCCHSYCTKSDAAAQNSAFQFTVPDTSLEVACTARNCQYNENNRCHAEQIDISGKGASCKTDTECTTFHDYQ